MEKMIEIRWHGRGGQGAKTASLLLADAAFNTGKYIQGFPEYGPERMGAPITAYNRISDTPITIHSNIYEPDYVVVVDDTLLSSVPVTDGLKKELELDRLNGFIGKTCIHPSQLKYVSENNIVTYKDYQNAISILGMADGLIGVQKGYGGDQMNEVKTHTTWAKKIMGLAEVYGVLKPEEGEEDV